jgi:hypothetical protein
VLRAFAETGTVPSVEQLARASGDDDLAAVLARLHAEDFLRLDTDGQILVAYPFSASRTAHEVTVSGGPVVHAMCAIDALGIAAMLSRPVQISSRDPHTGDPIAITVHPNGSRLEAQPAGTVVYLGRLRTGRRSEGDQQPVGAAVDTCCPHISFFASRANADAWAAQDPQIDGRVLVLDEAAKVGLDIFGGLLGPGPVG